MLGRERRIMAISRRRSCPACGRQVGRKRMHLKATLGSKWNCPGCGRELEFDGKRRVNVAGFSSLFGIAPAVIGASNGWWWLVLVGAFVFGWIWSFDSVQLRDSGLQSLGSGASER